MYKKIILSIFLLCFFVLFVGSVFALRTPTSYFPLDSNLYNYAGPDLITTGTVSYVTGVKGNGATSTRGAISDSDIILTFPYTVSFWYKQDDVSLGQDHNFYLYNPTNFLRNGFKKTTTDIYGYASELVGKNGYTVYYKYNSYSDFVTSVYDEGDRVHHVMIYYTTGMHMYADGLLYDSNTATWTVSGERDYTMYLFCTPENGCTPDSNYYSYAYDEIFLFSGALTTTEIAELYTLSYDLVTEANYDGLCGYSTVLTGSFLTGSACFLGTFTGLQYYDIQGYTGYSYSCQGIGTGQDVLCNTSLYTGTCAEYGDFCVTGYTRFFYETFFSGDIEIANWYCSPNGSGLEYGEECSSELPIAEGLECGYFHDQYFQSFPYGDFQIASTGSYSLCEPDNSYVDSYTYNTGNNTYEWTCTSGDVSIFCNALTAPNALSSAICGTFTNQYFTIESGNNIQNIWTGSDLCATGIPVNDGQAELPYYLNNLGRGWSCEGPGLIGVDCTAFQTGILYDDFFDQFSGGILGSVEDDGSIMSYWNFILSKSTTISTFRGYFASYFTFTPVNLQNVSYLPEILSDGTLSTRQVTRDLYDLSTQFNTVCDDDACLTTTPWGNKHLIRRTSFFNFMAYALPVFFALLYVGFCVLFPLIFVFFPIYFIIAYYTKSGELLSFSIKDSSDTVFTFIFYLGYKSAIYSMFIAIAYFYLPYVTLEFLQLKSFIGQVFTFIQVDLFHMDFLSMWTIVDIINTLFLSALAYFLVYLIAKKFGKLGIS